MTTSHLPATLPLPKQAPADRMKRLEERYLWPNVAGMSPLKEFQKTVDSAQLIVGILRR